jgi:hypothetical protein
MGIPDRVQNLFLGQVILLGKNGQRRKDEGDKAEPQEYFHWITSQKIQSARKYF